MKTYEQFMGFLGEAARRPPQKNGRTGHYALHLHTHIGGQVSELDRHLHEIKKKHGYDKVSVEHHNLGTDKYPERHRSELIPGNSSHSKYTLHHKDGNQEHIHVDHLGGKIHRIGHHSTVNPKLHRISVHGKSMQYESGQKKRTDHHINGFTHFEYHD